MSDFLNGVIAALAANGFNLGNLANLGSIWGAVYILQRRMSRIEHVHSGCPHATPEVRHA